MHRCRTTCSSTLCQHTVPPTSLLGTTRRSPKAVCGHFYRRTAEGKVHVRCVHDDIRDVQQPGQPVGCSELQVLSDGTDPDQSLPAHADEAVGQCASGTLQEGNEGESVHAEQRQQEQQPCSFHIYHPSIPKPVELPPADARPEAAAVKTFFWKAKYKQPGFLQHYPCRRGAAYNYVSFLGSADPHGGKYLVPQQRQEAFLESYFNTLHHLSKRMHIAECYNDDPYKYFQELDFPWSLDVNLVLALIPRVVKIVTEETCRVHRHTGPLPEPVISMRTPYKVHLNFPSIITVAAIAGNIVRKAVINRCRTELSGQPEVRFLKEELQTQQQLQEAQQALDQLQDIQQQLEAAGHTIGPAVHRLHQEMHQQEHGTKQHKQQLHDVTKQQAPEAVQNSTDVAFAAAGDAAAGQVAAVADIDWESVIDFPHGSLRLMGSCKAPWMDTDPDWVTEKYYSQVKYIDGVWMRQPLTLAAIQQCSILLSAMEQRLYEQSEDFLEASYQSVKFREQLLKAKSILRRSSKYLTCMQKLQHALQDGDSTAVAASLQDAYKHFLLVRPESQQRKQQQVYEERQQQHNSGQSGAKAQNSKDAVEQQKRKQEALERLKRLQGTAGAGAAAAQQQGPKLIRPLS